MNHSGRIAELIESEGILISHHARIRMFERNISTDELIAIISSGEIIEEYPMMNRVHRSLSWVLSMQSHTTQSSHYAGIISGSSQFIFRNETNGLSTVEGGMNYDSRSM
jgi:hypothetical protein